MKRYLLFFSVILTLSFLFVISAAAEKNTTDVTDTFYVVTSEDSEAAVALKAEGKSTIVLADVYSSTTSLSETDWINQFEDGSHVELIFAENIVESVGENRGILLKKAITITVRYNGFCHLLTNGVSNENMFVLRHSGAQLNLIGSTDIYDESGNVIKDFTYDPNDLSKNMVQIRHSKVYAWVHDGGVYVQNIRSVTGQELVYTEGDDSTAEGTVNNTYEFVDCALSSGSVPVGLLGRGDARKIVKISGGYYSKVQAHTILTGTVFENCEIGTFEMDCWDISGQMAEFKNCTVGSVSTATGRTHLTFIDCKIDISKISLGSDGGGKCYALVYTSPNCENAGTLNIYRNGSGITPVTDDSKYPYTMVEEYVSSNPAFGHDNQSIAVYENGFTEKGYKRIGCTRCDNYEGGELPALFVCHGYSVPEYDAGGIAVRYSVDNDAIAEYERITGESISYGVFAVTKQKLGDNDIFASDGKASSGVIAAEISNEQFNLFELKIVGFTADQKDKKIALGAFVGVNNGDTTEYTYIQAGVKAEGEKYVFVSYNDIVNPPSSDEE
ncbi:MAG: hypothetical protein J6A90_02610 [Clostridia bacterium]|nr:hypothetical protein [Clostridia bacterium]